MPGCLSSNHGVSVDLLVMLGILGERGDVGWCSCGFLRREKAENFRKEREKRRRSEEEGGNLGVLKKILTHRPVGIMPFFACGLCYEQPTGRCRGTDRSVPCHFSLPPVWTDRSVVMNRLVGGWSG